MKTTWSTNETGKEANMRKTEAFFVQFEEESVLSIFNMMLSQYHLRFSIFLTLKKWRITNHYINSFFSPDHTKESSLFYLVCMVSCRSQSQVNLSLHFICRNKSSRICKGLRINICGNKFPTKQSKAQQRINKCSPCSNIKSYMNGRFNIKINPQKIVEARWYSRTEVGKGAVPLQAKTMTHDSLCEGNETSLLDKIAYCAMIENKDVRAETRFEYDQFIEIYREIVDESKKRVLISLIHDWQGKMILLQRQILQGNYRFEFIIYCYYDMQRTEA